jgi:hypothetical protein
VLSLPGASGRINRGGWRATPPHIGGIFLFGSHFASSEAREIARTHGSRKFPINLASGRQFNKKLSVAEAIFCQITTK